MTMIQISLYTENNHYQIVEVYSVIMHLTKNSQLLVYIAIFNTCRSTSARFYRNGLRRLYLFFNHGVRIKIECDTRVTVS